jgi:hypothetical protein
MRTSMRRRCLSRATLRGLRAGEVDFVGAPEDRGWLKADCPYKMAMATYRPPVLPRMSPHSAIVAHPLAGITSCRHQSGVGSEPVGAREGADVAHGYQELLGPEDRSHARHSLARIRASGRAKKR